MIKAVISGILIISVLWIGACTIDKKHNPNHSLKKAIIMVWDRS